MKHICPKCGGRHFLSTAHVTQTWMIDEDGMFEGEVSGADDILHAPDDDDIWVCANCGYDASGEELLREEPHEEPKEEEKSTWHEEGDQVVGEIVSESFTIPYELD